jgi:hypothetical protein
MTQRQSVPESSNEERRARRIWRGMGRVLGKAREHLNEVWIASGY